MTVTTMYTATPAASDGKREKLHHINERWILDIRSYTGYKSSTVIDVHEASKWLVRNGYKPIV